VPRKPFPVNVQSLVLAKCKRKCALCFCLDDDDTEKEGQLAHIDRDAQNNSEDNAAFLCTRHHSRYDSSSRQTKGILPDELKEYQRTLYSFLEIAAENQPKRQKKAKNPTGVSLEIYDRRLPIYTTTMQFIRDVSKDLRPDLQLILKFGHDTDQALFLFDESIANYLDTLLKRALRLHTVELLCSRAQSRPEDSKKFPELVNERTDLAVWFANQPREVRTLFAPFLRLA
jgi:hypothetical protein